jgi:hypothetical protein
MKKPFVAFLLSFLLPGAGLAYLGKWKWAFINFGVVILIGVVAVFALSDATIRNYGSYLGIGCAAGSAGLARAVAELMNKKRNDAA